MAEHELKVQEVDYLSATNGKIGDEAVTIITLRPDLPVSYRPHNISLPRSQAERLLEDLRKLLAHV